MKTWVKRQTFLFVLLMGFAVLGKAQSQGFDLSATPRHEISVSYGLSPLSDLSNTFSSAMSNIFSATLTGGLLGFEEEIDHQYSGAFSVGYSYRLSKIIALGANVGYSHKDETYQGTDKDVVANIKTSYVYLIPTVRCYWWVNPQKHFNCYSSAGIGVVSYREKVDELKNDGVTFAGQLNLLGVEYGTKLNVFAELGVGNQGFLTLGLRGRF